VSSNPAWTASESLELSEFSKKISETAAPSRPSESHPDNRELKRETGIRVISLRQSGNGRVDTVSEISFCLKPRAPFRLDLTVGALRRRPNNAIDLWDGSIDYIVQRVGPLHVGIGLDYVYDQEQDELPSGTDPAYWFPTEFGYDDNFYRASAFVPPEKVPELMNELSTRGYSHEDIEAIWGGNFL